MTREVEMNKAFKLYEQERKKADSLPLYDLWEGFKAGFKYADSHPQYFRGQTDEMMERESLFCDAWFKEHKGEMPTYADAIAWAEKRMIEKASEWLFNNTDSYMVVAGTGHWINNMGLVKDFKKAMEE